MRKIPNNARKYLTALEFVTSAPKQHGLIVTMKTGDGMDDPRPKLSSEQINMSSYPEIALNSPPITHDFYSIEERPPWHITILLGFQHYLLMYVSAASKPLIFASAICLPLASSDMCDVINTVMFVGGITTILQTTLGVRLPIVQGASFAYVFPLLAIMSQPKWQCPSLLLANGSREMENASDAFHLAEPEPTADTMGEAPWKERMREIQGAVLTASLFQVLAGATGIMQCVLRYIGPLTIAPTITIIGLGLFGAAAETCSLQWGIALLTVVLITVFSQYMRKLMIPCNCRGTKTRQDQRIVLKYPIFSMLSFIFAILMAWFLCFVLTVSGALGEHEGDAGYHARTDIKMDAIKNTAWFRVPYPCQWGLPTFSISGTLGMLSGVMASMIESIGDYYACARVSGVSPPPSHAVNRGLLTEGIGGVLSGLMGTGVGSTSYSANIAAISITKVASLRVIHVTGLFMLVLSVFGKLGAIFVSIPSPVIGGLYIAMFGMVTAVGLSNLAFVDLNSSRNLYILGISIITGLAIPHWIHKHPEAIETGVDTLDQVLTVLLTTGMFLAGLVAFVLDNTAPGTLEERGILRMKEEMVGTDAAITTRCYDIPVASRFVERFSWTKRIPFCQNYEAMFTCRKCCNRDNSRVHADAVSN